MLTLFYLSLYNKLNIIIYFVKFRKAKFVSIDSLLHKISEYRRKNEVLWFRGHSDYNYKLNSGLYRITSNKADIRTHENNIFNSFLNYGYGFCNSFTCNTNWNTLFLMQHYGLYTRLLDWTDSLITALYFAVQGNSHETDPCLWILNPIKLNNNCKHLYDQNDQDYPEIGLITIDTIPKRVNDYIQYYKEDIDISSFSIMPRRNNDRLISQNGFFTVQGTQNIPLEEEYPSEHNDFLFCIKLEKNDIKEYKNFLKLTGINYYSLYGGADGLCKYIKDELLEIKLTNI